MFLEAQFSAPWCVNGKISSEDCKPFQVTPRYVIGLHFVASGQMQLRVDDGDAIDVRAGELVLLPHNHAHIFGSELSVDPVSAREVIRPAPVGELARIEYGGGGEATQVLCGFLGTDHPFGPLLSSLPAVLKAGCGRDTQRRVGREFVSICRQSDRRRTRRARPASSPNYRSCCSSKP